METNHELDPQRVCTLVLARLLPERKDGVKREKVIKTVASLLPGVTATASVEQAWKLALNEGWLEERGALTAAGRRELAVRLGVEQLPKAKDWPAVQRAVLGRLALGLAPASGKSDFAADVVCATHSLQASTLRAAVDRLAWRTLGVDTDAKFEALAVQRYLLRELVPGEEKLKPESFRRLVAARSLQTTGASNAQLRGAAMRRWAAHVRSGNLRPAETRGLVVTANDNTNRGETSLELFAAAVVEAARKPGVTRFHDDRAFIGSIWEHMRGREPVFSMPLDEFKQKLVDAHRERLIRMSRADLVQAMDPAEVARSEARYRSATFHFVSLQAGGAR